jgi:TPP-dependent indolepyruvate ferredoxin oxidoreductase alpha subunit
MTEITKNKPGMQILLLGNEAITRGALEAGVDVATTYPGTPSSEIADTFSAIAKEAIRQKKDPGFSWVISVIINTIKVKDARFPRMW